MSDKDVPDTLGLNDPVQAVKLETFLDYLTDTVNRTITAHVVEMADHRAIWAADSGLRAQGIALLCWVRVCPLAAGLGGPAETVSEIERWVRFEIADGVIIDAVRMPTGVVDSRDALLAHMLGLWEHFRVPFLRKKITAILGGPGQGAG
jgi:hypothetical protein